MGLVQHVIDRMQMNYRDDYDDELEDFEEDERDERFTLLNHFRRNDQPEEDENMQVVLIRAESVEDSKEICDQLLAGNVVVMNMENASNDQKCRIIDFISGAVYGLNGNILSVSNSIYVTAPEDIELSDGK
jgi:cell division inhibitor SepF